ncbi:hypothetical protein BKP35_09860 [Anaerobacillus arseniciselenatis]|uniref:Histone deacetylase n=1 Tax=Anaerobacillus arseniciselenatis TaxID=85682 RepID=A0A1S2LKK3_9BACI|nr:hypothetical protein [Anaerobacillus arseniciselenatis]OIJ12864.1 hypothetical protein BKP35_09860 [Anaerobacillus arseniciselenatis]
MNENNYVWYASYGSNLSKDRFLCYIRGGKPEGSEKEEVGCRDQSLPLKEETFVMNFPLYFAKNSDRWQQQGVAFIGLTKDQNEVTYSRKYLITKEQFLDVVKQENNGVELDIDLEKVKKEVYLTLRDSWYGTILFLGEAEGASIFTFTADWDLDVPFNKPSEQYLSMIIEGLKRYVNLNSHDIINYLSTKPGVIDNYCKEEIEKLI